MGFSAWSSRIAFFVYEVGASRFGAFGLLIFPAYILAATFFEDKLYKNPTYGSRTMSGFLMIVVRVQTLRADSVET